MTSTIAIFNQKGGVGKTATTVSLAAGLADQGQKVLLIDIDPQGNAGMSLGQSFSQTENPAPDIRDLLLGEADLPQCLIPIRPDLDLIPSNLRLARAELNIAAKNLKELLLRKVLRPLIENHAYDFILIDCPPNPGVFSVNALMAADFVLIPVDMSPLALDGVGAVESILEIIREDHPLQLLGVLATKFDARNRISKEVLEALAEHFQSKLFKTTIPLNVRLNEAPGHGIPIFEYAPDSSGAFAYKALTQEFLQVIRSHTPAKTSSRA